MALSDTQSPGDPSIHLPLGSSVRRRFTAEFVQAGTVVCDIVIICATGRLAHVLHGTAGASWRPAPMDIALSLLFVLFMALRRAYATSRLSQMRDQALAVAVGWCLLFFALGWIAFWLQITSHLSRGVVSLHFLLGLAALLGFHVVGALWLDRCFRRGWVSLWRVAVIVTAEDPEGDARLRAKLRRKGIEAVRIICLAPEPAGTAGFAAHCQTAVDDLRAMIATIGLDSVYLFLPWQERQRIHDIKAALVSLPVPIVLIADGATEPFLSAPPATIGDMTGFEIQPAPLGRMDRAIKRLFDIVVAGIGLILLSPVMLLATLATIADSGFPVLFRQTRKGFSGRRFEILKFRSMTVMENSDAIVQATRDDPRITRIGRVLRRTSIDELPQLFNVLKGDMSIVGPRPHAIAHDDRYDSLIASYAVRQHVKPGMTGWAQVHGYRGETRDLGQMAARVEHDLWYIHHWSIWLDVKVVIMTAMIVLVDDTAY